MSMEDFENPYQTLKLEYQELINECRQTKLDNAERFQSYQEKVLKELAQILKERVEFEENWERKLRESDIGRRGLPVNDLKLMVETYSMVNWCTRENVH
ncbi:hypothetical protein BC833DRAFT_579606 [Globomyces pollinis-pini]|nr:hypothetical protein BC833DRAFT_579606 [Globomyces pollinis-pini]